MIGQVAKLTDTGRKRRRNEDAYVVQPPLFAVADGMGGAQAGEVASKLAKAALEDTDPGALSGPERVISLIQEANRRVHERSNADPATSGMGTTMTVALVEGSSVAIGHVGDSRAYLVRDGRLEQLTEDHSLVNELLKSGKLSPEEAETHPQRSVITRAVGTDPDVDVDSFTIDTQEGDIFVICSDGLTDMVDDDDLLDVIEHNLGDLDHAARELVGAANRGGGEDNITVVAFEIVPDGSDAEETVRLPAAAENADEDTLDGQHSAPRVDTMVVPPERVDAFTVSADGAAAVDYSDGRDRLQRRARLQLVLTILLLLAVAAGLILWELLR